METTPPTQKVKRVYVYKRLLTPDELWKLTIPLLWIDFILFFLPHWAEEIDFTKQPVFLDKELRRLRPKSKSKRRIVDILMRVSLKNGKTKTLLLHIEVQSYYDEELPFRVYQYNYRIVDFFGEPIETFVLLLDEDPKYRPNEYNAICGLTKNHFEYPVFKLLDNPPPYLGKEDNLFSIVMEVAWYGLEKNMLKNDDEIETLRLRLIRKLLEKEKSREVIYNLLDFISIYLPFADKKKEPIFDHKIESLIDDEPMEVMTIRDYLVQKMEKKERAAAKRREKALELRLKQKEELRLEEERKRQEAEIRSQEAEIRSQEAEIRSQEAEIRIQEEERLRLEEKAKNRIKLVRTAKQLSAHQFSLEAIAGILSETTDSVQAMLDEPDAADFV